MKRFMQKTYVKAMGALQTLQNQKGAQAIEWIALAGVVLAIFTAIAAYFKDGEQSVGEAVSQTLSDIINGIAGK
ncbi:hypothetical protein LOK74_14320 [Brevibacillus humidisoli]|uniref:hypothetical protein n=1 Tax=Brevibacillus humidisoli TaxID=2895522 RepID=UPI001E3A857C|nr:hypothetical protein [Brevibacillus humidisoli]UFJ39245.1 hypothetical protein LOK74_14320 [Brevibacillus humidisoli]